MRVAVISGFDPGYEVGLEYSYARALQGLGHEVATIREVPEHGLRAPRGLNQIEEWARVRHHEGEVVRQCAAFGPDLVLLVKGRGISAAQVRRLRARGHKVINVFPDNPFEAASSGLVARGLWEQYRELDCLFVHDRFAVGQLRQMGVRAEFIAFARDPTVHTAPPPVPVPRDAAAIVFVGNPDPERIRYLRAVSDLGLALYGAWDWAKLSADDPLASCVSGPVQLGSAMVHAMRHAILSVNVLRHSQKTAHNMRTFEAPACGACAVSEASIGVEEQMRAGRDVLVFRTPAELRALAKGLIASSTRALEVANAGYERVRGETYEKRAAELLSILRL